MVNPLLPIQVQFTKAGNQYRLEATVSRVLPRELSLVISAFTTVWTKPEDIERVPVGGVSGEALIVTLIADHELRVNERPADIAHKLTYTIWQKLDRYVKVTVEATYLGESPDSHFEYGEEQYAQAYGARFEG